MSDYREMFRTALRDGPVELTDAGRSRRAEMQQWLGRAVDRRRRRRKITRAAVAAAAIVGLSLLIARGFGDGATVDVEPDPVVATERFRRIELIEVRDDRGLLAKYTVRPTLSPDVFVRDDAELVELLRSSGRQTGVIRAGDTFLLTDDPVGTD